MAAPRAVIGGCSTIVLVTATPRGRASARSMRARRLAAKSGSGSVGTTGSRSASNGSVIYSTSVPGVSYARRKAARARTSNASVACRVRSSSRATSGTGRPSR